MKILVTGACGFIGSHLVEKLVELNHHVKAFTFYNSRGSHGWLDNIDKKLLKEFHKIKVINKIKKKYYHGIIIIVKHNYNIYYNKV